MQDRLSPKVLTRLKDDILLATLSAAKRYFEIISKEKKYSDPQKALKKLNEKFSSNNLKQTVDDFFTIDEEGEIVFTFQAHDYLYTLSQDYQVVAWINAIVDQTEPSGWSKRAFTAFSEAINSALALRKGEKIESDFYSWHIVTDTVRLAVNRKEELKKQKLKELNAKNKLDDSQHVQKKVTFGNIETKLFHEDKNTQSILKNKNTIIPIAPPFIPSLDEKQPAITTVSPADAKALQLDTKQNVPARATVLPVEAQAPQIEEKQKISARETVLLTEAKTPVKPETRSLFSRFFNWVGKLFSNVRLPNVIAIPHGSIAVSKPLRSTHSMLKQDERLKRQIINTNSVTKPDAQVVMTTDSSQHDKVQPQVQASEQKEITLPSSSSPKAGVRRSSS